MNDQEHPDVIQLEKKLKDTWHKRDIKELREKIAQEKDVNEDVPPSLFYCKECDKDYVPNRIYKREVQDWNTEIPFRYWKARCHCDKWNTRLITDKVKDIFFVKSPTIKRERRLRKKDILQPQDTGYQMLYGNK